MTIGARPIERIAAGIGAAACLVLTIRIWIAVAAQQNVWVFPALYFIEVVLLSAVCAIAFVLSWPSRTAVAWAAWGALVAFSVLGAWTVGLYYMPLALPYLVLALASDLREKGPLVMHMGLGVLASLMQAAAMLAIARAF